VFRDIIAPMKLHCASVSHFRSSHFTQLPFRKLRSPPLTVPHILVLHKHRAD